MTNLDWKVYGADGVYTAATKRPEEAAMLVSAIGNGSRIKYKHAVLCWHEGKETQAAWASYDHVAKVCTDRANASRRFALALEQMRKQAATLLPGDMVLLAESIAILHQVRASELLIAYTRERARFDRLAEKRTKERGASGTGDLVELTESALEGMRRELTKND